mmetsp:Transcript_64519/g.131120  ORF Transcript_64519/g.131120 Transcript_64519/m.131120 type:complete len:209 (-) Transcript_64519:60-686(-)
MGQHFCAAELCAAEATRKQAHGAGREVGACLTRASGHVLRVLALGHDALALSEQACGALGCRGLKLPIQVDCRVAAVVLLRRFDRAHVAQVRTRGCEFFVHGRRPSFCRASELRSHGSSGCAMADSRVPPRNSGGKRLMAACRRDVAGGGVRHRIGNAGCGNRGGTVNVGLARAVLARNSPHCGAGWSASAPWCMPRVFHEVESSLFR